MEGICSEEAPVWARPLVTTASGPYPSLSVTLVGLLSPLQCDSSPSVRQLPERGGGGGQPRVKSRSKSRILSIRCRSTIRPAEYWPAPSSASAVPFGARVGLARGSDSWHSSPHLTRPGSPSQRSCYLASTSSRRRRSRGCSRTPSSARTSMGRHHRRTAPPGRHLAWETKHRRAAALGRRPESLRETQQGQRWLSSQQASNLAAAHAATCRRPLQKLPRSLRRQACPREESSCPLDTEERGHGSRSLWCLPKVAVPACAPRRVDEARGRLSSRR